MTSRWVAKGKAIIGEPARGREAGYLDRSCSGRLLLYEARSPFQAAAVRTRRVRLITTDLLGSRFFFSRCVARVRTSGFGKANQGSACKVGITQSAQRLEREYSWEDSCWRAC